MQVHTQIALCLAPVAAAAFIVTSLIGPATIDSGDKAGQIDSLSQRYQVLEIRLKQRQKLQAKQRQIQKEIARLRNSVPNKPDVDLFMYDLEKICEANQVALLGVEEKDTHKTNKKDSGLIASLVEEVGGKLPSTGSKKTPDRNTAANTNKKKVDDAQEDPLGLKHETKRVFISGKFNGLVGVLRNLEKYQRIVGIRDLIIAMPTDDEKEFAKTIAANKGKELSLSQPVMTFLIHIYYLPE